MDFPCYFPVKVIGTHSQQFIEDVKCIAKTYFTDFKEEHIKQQTSQKSNYLALTVTVFAKDQPTLDAFYEALTKLPDIKMVL